MNEAQILRKKREMDLKAHYNMERKNEKNREDY